MVLLALFSWMHNARKWMHKKIRFFPPHYFTDTLVKVKKVFHVANLTVIFSHLSVSDQMSWFLWDWGFPWIWDLSGKTRSFLNKTGQLLASSFLNYFLYLTGGSTLSCSLSCIIGHWFAGLYLWLIPFILHLCHSTRTTLASTLFPDQ